MLSESQAQDLLCQAGDTIEVAPAGPLDTALAPRRRWPVMAAAAAVVLVVGSITLAIPGKRDAFIPPPTPADPNVSSDNAFHLGPDQVPSVFGLKAGPARALLEDRGLVVTEEVKGSCTGDGHAAGTDPGPGSLISPGDSVLLAVYSSDMFDCEVAPGWSTAYELLDAALDQGAPPLRYAGVDLAPALDVIRRWAGEVGRRGGSPFKFTTPVLSVVLNEGPSECHEPVDDPDKDIGYWLSLTISPPAPPNGDVLLPCPIALHLAPTKGMGGDAIDSVVVPATPAPRTGPPDVVGNTVRFAEQRLEGAGYQVDVRGCDLSPDSFVGTQSFGPGSEWPPGRTVLLTTGDVCGDAEFARATAASVAFLAFAHGSGTEPAPPLAADVALYRNDNLFRSVAGSQLQSPGYWLYTCPPDYPCTDPGAESALTVAATFPGPVARSAGPAPCTAQRQAADLDVDTLILVSISPPRAVVSCREDARSIELYIDAEGDIAAVNLLDPSPAPESVQLASVPDVVGLGRRDAIDALEGAGFQVDVVTSMDCNEADQAGNVITQTQTGMAPSGSTIRLRVAGSPPCPPDQPS